MIEIGTLTLYREKSVVHRVEELNADEEEGGGTAPPALIMRSNRITIPVKTPTESVSCVVRGHIIPSTMRMAAMVVN